MTTGEKRKKQNKSKHDLAGSFSFLKLNKRPTAMVIPPSSGMVARRAGALFASALLCRLAPL